MPAGVAGFCFMHASGLTRKRESAINSCMKGDAVSGGLGSYHCNLKIKPLRILKWTCSVNAPHGMEMCCHPGVRRRRCAVSVAIGGGVQEFFSGGTGYNMGGLHSRGTKLGSGADVIHTQRALHVQAKAPRCPEVPVQSSLSRRRPRRRRQSAAGHWRPRRRAARHPPAAVAPASLGRRGRCRCWAALGALGAPGAAGRHLPWRWLPACGHPRGWRAPAGVHGGTAVG